MQFPLETLLADSFEKHLVLTRGERHYASTWFQQNKELNRVSFEKPHFSCG
jgi:hypothetical protein